MAGVQAIKTTLSDWVDVQPFAAEALTMLVSHVGVSHSYLSLRSLYTPEQIEDSIK